MLRPEPRSLCSCSWNHSRGGLGVTTISCPTQCHQDNKGANNQAIGYDSSPIDGRQVVTPGIDIRSESYPAASPVAKPAMTVPKHSASERPQGLMVAAGSSWTAIRPMGALDAEGLRECGGMRQRAACCPTGAALIPGDIGCGQSPLVAVRALPSRCGATAVDRRV